MAIAPPPERVVNQPNPEDDPKNNRLRNIILGAVGVGLSAAAAFGVSEVVGGEKDETQTRDTTSSAGTLEDVVVPGGVGSEVDPNAKKQPLDQFIDPSIMPRKVSNAEELGLPAPGVPVDVMRDYNNHLASAINSGDPSLVRELYGNDVGEAYEADMQLFEKFSEVKEDVKRDFPATPELSLAIETLDPKVDESVEYADGISFKGEYTIRTYIVGPDGEVYENNPWSSELPTERAGEFKYLEGYPTAPNGGLVFEFTTLPN